MENTKIIYIQIVLGLVLSLQVSCAPKKHASNAPPPSVPEEAYCANVVAVSNAVTLSGSAKYQYLKPQLQGLTLDTNTNEPFVNPIRHAEVRVKDSTGHVVQCGETDNSGNYSVSVEKPLANSTFTVEINARGSGSIVNASILDKPSVKALYTISSSVSVTPTDSAVTILPIIAPAQVSAASPFQKLEGGAFHIFDTILTINEYLRANTQCASPCVAFTVAPKVTVYWVKGFNPGAYMGETLALSFFDGGGSIDLTPGLYILGGSNGDVDTTDTDHFDDSVIIHEYGHFLERTYWRSDNPGGIHNGNMIIDPRMAFSEGFANFLPSAVTGSKEYLDTVGSPYGTTLLGVHLDLEEENGNSARDKIITMSPIGEGTYREVSVSRAFYDYLDNSPTDQTYNINGTPNNVTESANFSFAYLWLALTNSTFGLKAPGQHFVSMGLFNKAFYQGIATLFPGDSTKISDADSARIGEFQGNDVSEYAHLVTLSNSTCTRTMAPVNDRTSGSSTYHDLFASSDFYRIDHPGGLLNLTLSYTSSNANSPTDLDLYVYREVHSLSDSGDIVAFSDKSSQLPTDSESFSSNLPAGTYMIMVNADTRQGAGSSVNYELKSGGQSLCNAQ